MIRHAVWGLILNWAVIGHAFAATDKLVIHINEDDSALFHEVLTNIENIQAHYEASDDDVVIEVVAYGKGITMLLAETSPVADRIEFLQFAYDGLTFTACGNTLDARAKHHDNITLLDDGGVAQTGIVRIMELQQQGYSYLKP